MRARLIGGLPSNFVGSLTGLTQGRFPVHAKATYAGQVKTPKEKTKAGENAALVVESHQERRGIKIFARKGAPVIAVNDGRIVRKGENERLGKFIVLQDSYGNTYTYGHLATVSRDLPGAEAAQDDQGEDRQGARAADGRRQADRGRLATPSPRRPAPSARSPPQKERTPRRRRAARRRARQAAPVRPPVAPELQGRRRRRPARRRLPARRLRPDRPRRQGLREEAAQEGLARRRRHDPRPHRQDRPAGRPARPLRAPPGRPRRPARRSEADPRRLEAARVDRDLPRQGQEPVLRRRRREAHARPDPADGQGRAGPPRARQPAHRRLLLRRPRHPLRRDRPPRARHARVPRRLRPEADGHRRSSAATA